MSRLFYFIAIFHFSLESYNRTTNKFNFVEKFEKKNREKNHLVISYMHILIIFLSEVIKSTHEEILIVIINVMQYKN